MTTHEDLSFTYRGFHALWNWEKKHFEIRESGTAYFFAYAINREKAKAMIDKEVGK